MPEIATWTFGSVVAERRVAFVGDDDDRARLGDEEVAARDAHVGGEIVLPQYASRLEAQLLDHVLARRAVLLLEELRDLVLALVQRRSDDVRRRLVVVDLQDVLAEIGLDDRHAGALDRVVERRLLGDHRLRLDDLAHAVAARDVEHEAVDFVGRLREQHGGAARRGIRLEDLEPDVEVVEARWRIARAASRVPSKSSSSTIADLRAATNLLLNLTRFFCRSSLPRLSCARSLKCIDATCISAPFRPARTSATCSTRVV